MYELDASAFQNAVVILQHTIGTVDSSGFPQNKIMTPENRADTISQIQKLQKHVDVLRCPITSMSISDLAKNLSQENKLTYFSYANLALNISNTLKNELTHKKVYVLDPLRAHLYDPPEPLFGKEVQDKFPSIIYEIAQAGRCYACDLTTASAFHSLRCLEAGLRAIARCLNIPDPTKARDRNWGEVLRDIKAKIDTKWPTVNHRMNGDGKVFDELHGSLAAIQNPYRNSTMHLDAVHTAPDAIYLFEVVKGLMSRIASRMDEQGQPLA